MKYYTRKTPLKSDCPLEKTLNVISGKWKPAILCELIRGECRLRDLEKYNPEATKRALSKQLKELLDDGIIQKKDYEEFPKKVEYSLSPLGKEIIPVIKALTAFGILL